MLPFGRILHYGNIAPEPVKIKKVLICGQSSFALDSTGKLYSTGANNNGQLGIGNKITQTSWVLASTGVDDVYGSQNTNTIIARKGNAIYTSGLNTFYTGNDTGTYDTFTEVIPDISTSFPFTDCYVKDIVTNNKCFHVLFGRESSQTYGTVFSMGKGVTLGLGDTITARYSLSTNSKTPTNVMKIQCTENNASILTWEYTVYTVGNNTFKQIQNSTKTQFNDYTGGAQAFNMALGDNRLVITRTDGLYEVGNTFNGQVNDFSRTLSLNLDLTSARDYINISYGGRSYVASIPNGYGISGGLYVKGQGYDVNGVFSSRPVPTKMYDNNFTYIQGGYNNYVYNNPNEPFYCSGANSTGPISEPGDGLRLVIEPKGE